MSKPWLTDPLYGGMSETAARRSYEAAQLAHRHEPRFVPREPAGDEEIARRKLIVESLLQDYEQAIKEAAEFMRGYRARRPRGFRALRRA